MLFCRLDSFCYKNSILFLQFESSHWWYINDWTWQYSNKTLCMDKETWMSFHFLDFFPQPFKKVKAILFHGQWQGGQQPDVGSSLQTPSLIQIKKKAMVPQVELILAIFLLKNVDFEFPTCYRPFCPISHPGMLASTKLTSRNAQVPERGLKPIKCFSLHNENQGNGKNKPPRVCF